MIFLGILAALSALAAWVWWRWSVVNMRRAKNGARGDYSWPREEVDISTPMTLFEKTYRLGGAVGFGLFAVLSGVAFIATVLS